MNKKTIGLILSWAAVIAVAVAIFLFSSQNAQDSTKVSHGLIEQLYLWYTDLFGLPCSSNTLIQISAYWDYLIRKIAHFVIYSLLGFCCCNALYQTFFQLNKSFFIALGMGCFYAVTDEFHQAFVPGRSCQFSDMVLDSCGVLFGILLFCSLFFILLKRRKVKL